MDIINPLPTTTGIPLESDIISNPITPTTSIVGESNPTPQLTPIEAVSYQPLLISNQPLPISNQPLAINNSNIDSLLGTTTNININPTFNSGVFTVENTGKITIDYLFDGGGYQGELAIFSLTGMEQFLNNYTSFIKEAATRSLSNTNQGHIVISDKTEGARLNEELGEKNQNRGDYLGVKTFNMLPGDKFGLMLTPNGTIQQVFDNPKIGGGIRPLFSLATANPNDSFQLGQIADITGNGNAFVMEDLRIDRNSDKDYNDMMFLVGGATGTAPVLSEVINPNKDWRTTEVGQSLIDYLDTTTPPENNNKITDTLSDRVRYAIERAEDLANYEPTALKSTKQWVVGVTPGYNSQDLATLFGSEYLGATGHIPNTHIIEFSKNFTPEQVQKRLDGLAGIEFAYPLVPTELVPQFIPNDPLFPNQWNLDNQHINVTPAWDTVTGKGVTIAIVDDGLQYTHPDLQGNYRADLSRDFNETLDSQGNVKLYENNPRGTYDTNPIATNGHGTTVAGIAAAIGNNNIGVSGVAPNADLAGLRLIEGKVNDKQIADALSYLRHNIDIYNNSWKPRNAFWASPMAEYELGIGGSQGRNGLGSIYVFAAGNDGLNLGNVNYNNFANSRQAITVGAVNSSGRRTGYSEPGASVLVSAYANGITTTDLLGNLGLNSGSSSQDYLNKDYTKNASGTSSAAPQVSGTIALMLEANPSLSLRDVQHILVETAVKNNPTNQGWVTNGAGNKVHDEYGFGVVDAAAAVSLAKTWTTVGSEVKISAKETFTNPILIPDNDDNGIPRTFNITEDITVESVEVLFDATRHVWRDLDIVLTSPDGTESVLASPHALPTSNSKDNKWIFTSVRNWGESSVGEWKLEVRDLQSGNQGNLYGLGLNIYGSKPTVTLKATDDFAAEGEDDGEFTVFRSGSNKNPLTVNYEIDPNYIGNKPPATNGVDYERLTGTITIPAGADSVKIPIKTLDDTVAEWPETVKLKLKENNGYQVGNSNVAWLLIADTETPQIAVYPESYAGIRGAWTSNYTSESGNKSFFHFQRYGNLSQPLTVNYSMTGDAINGVDYQTLPGSFTFPGVPNESLRDLLVAAYNLNFTAIDDSELESDETALFTITPSSDYTISSAWGTIPTLIADNDSKPTVSFTVNDSTVSEYGDKATFTLSRTGDTTNPLDVKLWITNRQGDAMAVNGKDFELINETITIPSGESSVIIDINPIDDNIVEPSERLDVLLVADPAYSFGAIDNMIFSIKDNDKPTVAWRQQLGTSGFDYANSVTNDSDGNIYITGCTTGNFAGTNAGLGDTFIAKYNSAGVLQWKQQLGTVGYDEGTGIAVDSTGNIYLTGWTDGTISGNSNSRKSWIAKYNNSGQLEWQKEAGNTAFDLSNGKITVDKDGNLYLAGRTYTIVDNDAWFAKYNGEGNQIWSKQLGNSPFDEATGIAVDNDGFVYLSGQTQGNLGGTNQGNADAWLAKYDGNGSQVWVKQLGTAELDKANGVAVDNKGHIYISGQTFGKLGDTYEGSPLDWVGDFGAGWAGALGDKSGLGGTYYGNGDAFVAQFDTDGNLKWKRLLGTIAADISTGVTADKLGNVYLSGYTLGNLSGNNVGSSDVFAAKYDELGALQWKQQLGSSGKDVVTGMAIGGTGIVMAGYSNGVFGSGSFGGDDGILVKLG